MSRYTRPMVALTVAAILATAALILPGTTRVATGSMEALTISIETRDDGYACVAGCDYLAESADPWAPVLDIPAGSLVEITFIWAHRAYPYEEHIMVLDGYGLESDLIDRDNRETTLRFIASEAGAFTFKCDLHCDLHDYMQRGTIRIGRGGGDVSAPQYTPTLLDLRAPAPVISGLEPVELTVTLSDNDGEPLERAELHFYIDAEFGGVRDLVHAGVVRTDESGIAQYRFQPFTADPDQRVLVRFAGMGIYDQSEQEITLKLTGSPPSAFVSEESRIESLKQGARIGVGLVIGAVWLTLAFVFVQALRMGRGEASQ
jgi:hypothetical protein